MIPFLLSLLVCCQAAFDSSDPLWKKHKFGADGAKQVRSAPRKSLNGRTSPQPKRNFLRTADDATENWWIGTGDKGSDSEYWMDEPNKENGGDGFYYDVVIEGRKERFWLERKHSLVSNDFLSVVREGDNSSVSHAIEFCVFQGHSVSHNGSSIALSGCDVDMHGLVITSNGEYFLIQPENRGETRHIIRKRDLSSQQHTCLFDPSSDPYPEDLVVRKPRSHLAKKDRLPVFRHEGMTIELAVFADDAMWRHFQRMYGSHADIELHKFVMAVVNNIDILYSQRSIQPRIQIKVVRYEVLKLPPRNMQATMHRHGDVDKLLDAFCQFQHGINSPSDNDPRHWDHALLFSGHDLYRDGLHTVAGYAPVKGMCTGSRSCTINEGLDFGSVFVVTHEMGHSLGMYHDGDNECDLKCCIMSPSVGSGKTHWSRCSVKEMRAFLGRMGGDGRATNCLMDSPLEEERMVSKNRDSPGQEFTLDDQCEVFHGECWKHELKDGQSVEDVCSMVWCGNGEGVIRTAHPALEGSNCGFNKQCRNGLCVPSTYPLVPIHGGWSPWNDSPAPPCGGQCTQCQIQGQVRVRRSIRRCNQPSANNGGIPCSGDDARGLRCSDQVCSGVSATEFASRECTRVRDDRSLPNPQLTGEGLQFELAPCKVWCHLVFSNNIRTVGNFPDGTPCGQGKYCMKGECRPLLCQATTIAYSTEDCPRVKPLSYKEEKKPPFWQEWSGWSEWSLCFSATCGTPGYRLRTRRCFAGECVGQSKQKAICTLPCDTVATNPPEVWTPWSGCSVSCGNGWRLRRKKDCTHNCTETAPCSEPPCAPTQKGLWSEWSLWSPCSGSCGAGVQNRRRACSNNNCPGPERETRHCSLPACLGWSEWGLWSKCTSFCGPGTRYRQRHCRQPPCIGEDREALKCTGIACDPGRLPREVSNTTTTTTATTTSAVSTTLLRPERHFSAGSTSSRRRP